LRWDAEWGGRKEACARLGCTPAHVANITELSMCGLLSNYSDYCCYNNRQTKHSEVMDRQLITFRTKHSGGEMYSGHGRLCVCLLPHSHTTARTRMYLGEVGRGDL